MGDPPSSRWSAETWCNGDDAAESPGRFLPRRPGAAPPLWGGELPGQIGQQPEPVVWERLVRLAGGLRGVILRPTGHCAPGSTGLHLAPKLAEGPPWAFLHETQFAHLHPAYNGSVHVALPPLVATLAERTGWGHQEDAPGGRLLLFGPRDDADLRIVWILLQVSYRYARGLPPLPGTDLTG